MPPKAQFSKEQILECAFAIAREEGLPKLSARSLAQRLGCSTSPIYTAFKTMQELEDLVCERSTAVMLQYQTRTYTGSPLLDLCLGYVEFATAERQLFRDMFLDKARLSEHSLRMRDFAFEQLRSKMLSQERALAGLSPERQLELLEMLWTYAHGLAAQLCVGALELPDQPALISKFRRFIEPLLAGLRS